MRYARLLACLFLVFLLAAIGSQLLRRAIPTSTFDGESARQAAGIALGPTGAPASTAPAASSTRGRQPRENRPKAGLARRPATPSAPTVAPASAPRASASSRTATPTSAPPGPASSAPPP